MSIYFVALIKKMYLLLSYISNQSFLKLSWLIVEMVAILKISNPKCTTTHPKHHVCEVSLQSDQKNIF